MDIADFLRPADTLIDVRAVEKSGLLRRLAVRAATALNLAADEVLAELLKRESLGSTGTGGGIALPHARLARIEKPFGVLARLDHPIAFDAIDSQPVDLVFLLLLPSSSGGASTSPLAQVARKLRDGKVLTALRKAGTAAELYRVIVGDSL